MKTKALLFILLLFVSSLMAQDEVTIGTQVWMKYNLVSDAGVWYGNSQANAQYGKLYTYDEALEACPDGWRLPTKEDWRVLDTFLGSTYDDQGRTMTAGESARKLQEVGFAHWFTPYASKIGIPFYASTIAKFNGQDLFGFTALPAGYGYGNAFYNLGKNAYFWTSTTSATNNNYVWYRGISYATPWLTEVMAYRSGPNAARFSVRCIKD